MKLIKVFKILCDICFYLTFANFFGAMVGGTSLLLAIPVIAVSSYLSILLVSKGVLKYAPLLLLGTCFFIIPLYVANIVILVTVFVYMVYIIAKIDNDITILECKNQLKLYSKITAGFVVIPLLIGMAIYIGEFSVPYMIIFFVCISLSMRMLRHDKEMLKHAKFNIINISIAVGTIALITLFVSNAFLRLLNIIYFNAIAPAFMFILNIFISLLGRHIDPPGVGYGEPPEIFDHYDIGALNFFEDLLYVDFAEELYEPSLAFTILTYSVLLVLLVFMVFIVLKILKSEKYQHLAPVRGVNKIHARITGKPPVRVTSSQNSIRELYRKYLLFCKNDGMNIEKFSTSMDIEKKSIQRFKKIKTNEMRETYIKVRYGEKDFDRQDVKKFKEILGELRKDNS